MIQTDLARLIDHTQLAPGTTSNEIERLCREAVEHRFFAVCVNSEYVALAAELLVGTGVRVVSTVGFPTGAVATSVKAFEASQAVLAGADELDMVIQVGLLRAGRLEAVEEDIRAVIEAAAGAPVKVILETGLLTDEEIVAGCRAAEAAGAAFVKTSTGFGRRGATVEAVRLIRSTVGPDVEVKASGGIRSRADADAMIEAGATRLGTSSGICIVKGLESSGLGY